METAGKPIEILLVEDNPGDVRLTQEALKEGKIANHLSVAMDGMEALAFLRQEGDFGKMPEPDLILLDLNLPKKNGWEVLEEIKSDEQLKKNPRGNSDNVEGRDRCVEKLQSFMPIAIS